MKKVLFALSALVVLASSCKKDKDDDGPVTPTKENLVGSYKITKVELASGGQTANFTSTYFEQFEPCNRDNIEKLNADNTYQWVNAGTKCNPETVYSDTWSFTNSTTIVIDGDTYTIKSYNGKDLVLSENMGSAETIYTYTKQ
jgi:hypothetical protein